MTSILPLNFPFPSLEFACASYEFACASGDQCVTSRYRCDGVFDCRDHSDERDCRKLPAPTHNITNIAVFTVDLIKTNGTTRNSVSFIVIQIHFGAVLMSQFSEYFVLFAAAPSTSHSCSWPVPQKRVPVPDGRFLRTRRVGVRRPPGL